MENIINIARYQKDSETNKFVLEGYDKYTITYLPVKNFRFKLRIVVNGIITKYLLNILPNVAKKQQLLIAISYYKNNIDKYKNFINIKYKNSVKIEDYKDKDLIKSIQNYLLPISIETKRDTLTKYNLI